ncbi:MAG: DUF423 domain-containing protein [Myxococcales bacterium]|nr:DUF423 domain-containing protein [Myxococcales bacterium]
MSPRLGIFIGGLLGLTGVAAGAFGAHALRGALDPRSLEIWGTGAAYQQLHAVLLVAVAIWARAEATALRRAAMVLLAVGVVVFSGALYTVALGGPRILGAVAPVGGLCLMAGWAVIAIEGLRRAR